MTDWRTSPRTGKSQFFPLIDELKNRLTLGETYKQIYDDLKKTSKIQIGFQQFSKYMRTHVKSPTIKNELNGTVLPRKESARATTLQPISPVLTNNNIENWSDKKQHPFEHLSTPKGDRRRDYFVHNSVPDREEIYGTDSQNTTSVDKRPMSKIDFRKVREEALSMDFDALVNGEYIHETKNK
ncbi:hypothetical protein [Pseudomonas rossensis]|uniref:hypothetical protein n=1 Tax=Pseudomonas rossensis TaxID=2305471 RepID=UPI0032604DFB